MPTATDLQTDENKVLVDNIRELARQMKFHTLPRLQGWMSVVAEARQLYTDFPFAAASLTESSHSAIGVVDMDYRAGLLQQMITNIEEVLSCRCVALLGVDALT